MPTLTADERLLKMADASRTTARETLSIMGYSDEQIEERLPSVEKIVEMLKEEEAKTTTDESLFESELQEATNEVESPTAPGPGWRFVRTGPRGGKYWAPPHELPAHEFQPGEEGWAEQAKQFNQTLALLAKGAD